MNPRIALLITPLFWCGCSTVKNLQVSDNFHTFAGTYAPISIEDNQDGSLADQFKESLTTSGAIFEIMEGSPRYKLEVNLLKNDVTRNVEHDTERRTVKRRDREGRVISTIQKIVRYETIAVTRRSVALEYRLIDTRTDEVLWSAEAGRSARETNQRSDRWHYPPAPRHPDPPRLEPLTSRANTAAAKSLAKTLQKSLKQQAKAAAKAGSSAP